MGKMIISSGGDSAIKPVLEYLERQYGIHAKGVARVQLDAAVGDVQTITITLTLMVQEQDAQHAEQPPTVAVPLIRPAWRADDLRDAQPAPARPGINGPANEHDQRAQRADPDATVVMMAHPISCEHPGCDAPIRWTRTPAGLAWAHDRRPEFPHAARPPRGQGA